MIGIPIDHIHDLYPVVGSQVESVLGEDDFGEVAPDRLQCPEFPGPDILGQNGHGHRVILHIVSDDGGEIDLFATICSDPHSISSADQFQIHRILQRSAQIIRPRPHESYIP